MLIKQNLVVNLTYFNQFQRNENVVTGSLCAEDVRELSLAWEKSDQGQLAGALALGRRDGLPISFWISKPLTTLPTKLVTLLTLEDAAAG